jgi:hypothetical protein
MRDHDDMDMIAHQKKSLPAPASIYPPALPTVTCPELSFFFEILNALPSVTAPIFHQGHVVSCRSIPESRLALYRP